MKLNKPLSITAASIFALSVLMVAPEGSVITNSYAGDLNLTDAQNAKLARHKVKQRVEKNDRQEDYSPGDKELNNAENEDCGTVDIGNVFNDKGFGGPKKIDVIITGDIINANNDCD
ncbi:MAG: hypothetical protein KTR18_05485 [Acidiferrobacterales bacterium]|nr:hypothetical protein [Acidiferrobacterales bacterium]